MPHYNYYRDYDPSLGRYIESDPSGLEAGPNTFAYANSRPVSSVDPTGLDVVINYFGGVPGHIGIGVNSNQSVGMYPVRKDNYVGRVMLNPCPDAPGVVGSDDLLEGKPTDSITIKTKPWQDTLIQNAINQQRNRQQTYNVCNQQCTGFVTDMLRTGGVPVPNSPSIYPKTLFDQLKALNSGK